MQKLNDCWSRPKMQLKQKRCSYCKNLFQPKNGKHKVCSEACAIGLHEKSITKAVKASNREALKKLKRRSEWLADAQKIFNKFIRIRDGNNPCISCGRHHTGQYHAGHYRSVGSSPQLRFSELNCHRQCSVCNNHLSGNAINYRRGLIAKIGREAVERLESDNEPKKYTIEQIQEIIKKYRLKVKELENGNR